MARTKKLVIIGNGMAGNRLLGELAALDPEHLSITVVGAEPGPAYNRILLSSWLNGEISDDEIRLTTRAWYQRHGISLHDNDPALTIDPARRQITTAAHHVLDWDFLVLATGSTATRLSIPGNDANGVMCLRSLQDARELQGLVTAGGDAVVVGGGLLGLEAACSLADQGMSVTVVHNASWPMNRQLDAEAGARLAHSLRARGVQFHGDANCVRFNTTPANNTVRELELADGTRLPCSVAIMALGITPEISLARATGLATERAIKVDAWLRTSKPDIFALGECCQIDAHVFGLVEPVYQQAAVLAQVLNTCAGPSPVSIETLPCYEHKPAPTRLKVNGVDVFSAGDYSSNGQHRSTVWRDNHSGHYRRLWWQDNTLVAAVMFGDVSDSTRYAQLIDSSVPVPSPHRELLGLGGER